VIIVAGSMELDPDQRDAFVTSRGDAMRRSRAEPGCLEYTFAPDPLEPGRVILVERWESQEALEAHVAAMRARSDPASGDAVSGEVVAPRSSSITVYDVTGERSLQGPASGPPSGESGERLDISSPAGGTSA